MSPERRPRPPLLRDVECETLALALLEGSGTAGVTEDDVAALFTFAEETRVAGNLLRGVLDGRLIIRRRPDGEFEFRARTGVQTTAR